jgi:uncharacterized iron-regulated protein
MLSTLAMIGLNPLTPAAATTSDETWQSWTADDYASPELIGKIWSTKARAFVPPSELLTAVANARLIMLGENHDNAAHHRLQAWIIQNANLAGQLSVVMEQIDVSKSQVLENFLNQSDPNPIALGEALDWANSGWPDWELYLPIATAAINKQAKILPALPTRAETRRVGMEGFKALDPDRLAGLRLDRSLPATESQALREEIVEAHCDLLPTAMLPAMQAVQRFRDAYMAEVMLQAGAEGSAILISGNGHVNKARGVPWYLNEAGADSVLVIALIETRPGTEKVPQMVANDNVADFVWFTTHVDRGDPCAPLREHFRQD